MRNVLILTLFLAILTIGAVSAADSEVNNATYDEALSVPEADEATFNEIKESLEKIDIAKLLRYDSKN